MTKEKLINIGRVTLIIATKILTYAILIFTYGVKFLTIMLRILGFVIGVFAKILWIIIAIMTLGKIVNKLSPRANYSSNGGMPGEGD